MLFTVGWCMELDDAEGGPEERKRFNGTIIGVSREYVHIIVSKLPKGFAESTN
jgi:hypothetical protein